MNQFPNFWPNNEGASFDTRRSQLNSAYPFLPILPLPKSSTIFVLPTGIALQPVVIVPIPQNCTLLSISGATSAMSAGSAISIFPKTEIGLSWPASGAVAPAPSGMVIPIPTLAPYFFNCYGISEIPIMRVGASTNVTVTVNFY